MNRMIMTFVLGLTVLLTIPLSAEKKPQLAPLQSCYDGPVDEVRKGPVDKVSKGPVDNVSKGVVPPRILRTVDPEYTEEARRARIQGTVWVQIVLTPQGKPCPVKILRGLTLELDQNAAKAVEQWTFKPAEKDGKPIATQVNVEVAFRLY